MQVTDFEKNSGTSVFSIDNIWKEPGPIARKYRAFLTPDSDNYFSNLNPIFSYDLDDYSLKHFNVVSLRDGVYPLLRFFHFNPTPHAADCSLVIDASLASIVPVEWRSKVFLREIFQEPGLETKNTECMLLISPDKDSQPMELFEKEIEKYKVQLSTFKKISVYLSSCNLMGEEECYGQTNWGYSLLKSLLKSFPENDIEILDWAQYQKKNAAHISFLQINPLKFYFSDSYLVHDLLQRGAVSLENKSSLRKNAYKEKISIHHGYQIFSWDGPQFSYLDEDYKKVFSEKSISVKPSWDDFMLVKLSTSEFKDFAVHVAHRIHNT